MATYTQIIYHLVLATRLRNPVLAKARRHDLYRFMGSYLKGRHCHLFRMGAVDDHVHILASIAPTLALATLVKEIKTASAAWIRSERAFPGFTHWQEGYGAFTHAPPDKARLLDQIQNQERHHEILTFREEYEGLLLDAGLRPDRRDELWLED